MFYHLNIFQYNCPYPYKTALTVIIKSTNIYGTNPSPNSTRITF